MLPHNLQLKVGSVIMLHNLNQLKLWSGTGLAFKNLINNMFGATIMMGNSKARVV